MEKDIVPEKLLKAFDFAGAMAEKEKEHEEQMHSLLLSFLEVMDSCDRFFVHVEEVKEPVSEEASNWLNTFRLIRRQLESALKKAEVTPIPCLGKVFNPDIHEIVEVKNMDDVEEGIIMEEVKRGYDWKGKLLRRPQVVVAKKLK